MERRTFMTSMVGSAVLAASGSSSAGQTGSARANVPEFYIWRQYVLRTGSQPRRLAEYLQAAAIPALNRLGHTPVGVFDVVAGLPAPSTFVLIPCRTLEQVGALEASLDRDEGYTRAAAPYIDATAADPGYIRIESSLLAAFPRVPRIEVPAATATKAPRLFELRTYESASEKTHRAKVRMFEELGEIEIFRKVGLTPVFFARTLVGPRMPNLVYMLVHENMPGRDKSWDGFRTSPEWKKLAATPGFSDPEIVSNITTVFLRPSAASQV